MGKRTVIASRPFDMFARSPRITRAHPLREPNKHSQRREPEITEEEEEEEEEEENQPSGKKRKKAPANETAEQKSAREAQESLAKTRREAEWLIAEMNWKLEQEQDKNLTAEQREQKRLIREGSSDAVAAATVPLLTQIAKMQGQLVDTAISHALEINNLTVKDVEVAVSTLDKSKFLDEDGTVKTELVKSWADSLGSAGTKLPPRSKTGNKASTGSGGNGFGRYLED